VGQQIQEGFSPLLSMTKGRKSSICKQIMDSFAKTGHSIKKVDLEAFSCKRWRGLGRNAKGSGQIKSICEDFDNQG